MPSLITLTPAIIHEVSDEELTMTHLRAHQQVHNVLDKEDQGLSQEKLVSAHTMIVREMQSRNFEHHHHDELDETLPQELAKFGPTVSDVHIPTTSASATGLQWAHKAEGDTILVPGFVQVVGSATLKDSDPQDIDILVRADMGNDGRYFALQAEGLHLAIRKTITPKKDKKLHLLGHPQGPHQGTAIALADLVLRWRANPEPEVYKSDKISPNASYTLMKPEMLGYSDFTPQELGPLADWASKHYPVYGSAKIDGFRASLSYANKILKVRFEDSGNTKVFPINLPANTPDFVIEGEFTAKQNGKWLARTELAGVAAGHTKATPHFWIYDLLYYGERGDVSQEPFNARLVLVPSLHLPKANFTILEQIKITNRDGLIRAARWATGQPLSEGLYVRESEAPYAFGMTDTSAKIKKYLELKVIVLGISDKANGKTYHCGLRDPLPDITNTITYQDHEYVDLGNTFVAPDQHLDVGDTLNVGIEELVLGNQGTHLSWGKPTPRGPDKSRPAYTAAQAIDLARRFGTFKQEAQKSLELDLDPEEDLITQALIKAEPPVETTRPGGGYQDEPTRGAQAIAHWNAHFQDMIPRDGKAYDYVIHAHWRGLSEDEINLSLDALLQTDHSVHFDLRLGAGDHLVGWTIFAGTATENKTQLRIFSDKPCQATQKFPQPVAWLKVGTPKPLVVEPGGTGATSKRYSKFFKIGSGQVTYGVVRQHFQELVFTGSLKGRYTLQYARGGEGEGRFWVFQHQDNATPYAEAHDLDQVVADIAKHPDQKYLLWGLPGSPLRLINVHEHQPLAKAEEELYNVDLYKADNEKQLIYGVVSAPMVVDTQSDIQTAADIEDSAHRWLLKSRRYDFQHQVTIPEGAVEAVESYIAPLDFEVEGKPIKQGSWILVTKVFDNALWQQVKDGKINSYSIRGYGKRRPASAELAKLVESH